MWDAIIKATGVDPKIGSLGARVGKLVKELAAAGYTPNDVAAAAELFAEQHPVNAVITLAQLPLFVSQVRRNDLPRPRAIGSSESATFNPDSYYE